MASAARYYSTTELALVLEEEEDFRDTPPGGLLIILQDIWGYRGVWSASIDKQFTSGAGWNKTGAKNSIE